MGLPKISAKEIKDLNLKEILPPRRQGSALCIYFLMYSEQVKYCQE
jgi:hypothetical protein